MLFQRKKNELSENSYLNPGIVLNLKWLNDDEKDRIVKKFKERIRHDTYHVHYICGTYFRSETEDNYLADVIFKPRYILQYLQLEKDLKDEGFPVKFQREAKYINWPADID